MSEEGHRAPPRQRGGRVRHAGTTLVSIISSAQLHGPTDSTHPRPIVIYKAPGRIALAHPPPYRPSGHPTTSQKRSEI